MTENQTTPPNEIEIAITWRITATLIVTVDMWSQMEELQARAQTAMDQIAITGKRDIAEGSGMLFITHDDPIQLGFLNEDEAEAFKQQHQKEGE